MLSGDALSARLNKRHPRVIDLSLDRINELLRRLGNPHNKIPPVVHVAGTNGKGSVVAYLRAFAEAAGLKVHVYISPHLIRFNERIRVAGNLITDDAVLELLEECETAAGDDPVTYFEITTALAYLAFARTPADLAVIETGLGGRLDATNVFERPAVTALTPISLDHEQFLGSDIRGIAAEKAEIMRNHVPCVVSAQPDTVMTVIKDAAARIGAKLAVEEEDWSVARDGGTMTVRSGARSRSLPLPALAGNHQIHNAAQAVACVDALAESPAGVTIPDAAIATGLTTVEWSARLQRLVHGPLVEMLPAGWELWLDGGHNESAAEVIAHQAAEWQDKALHLIFGMINSKDPTVFLARLKPHVRSLAGITIPDESASLSATEVASAAADLGIPAAEVKDVKSAIERIVKSETGEARVLICGSLYLAGTILKENG